MNPVVGIDVSKGDSHGVAFKDKGHPSGPVFKITHTHSGLEEFLKKLRILEREWGATPAIIMEATGHYHLPLLSFLEEYDFLIIVINPLISQRARTTQLRKVKTDSQDAFHLAELYYKEEITAYKEKSIRQLNLRQITRQHSHISETFSQLKLQFQSILEQVLPTYKGILGNTCSPLSLKFLKRYPTSNSILKMEVGELTEEIQRLSPTRRTNEWANRKAKELIKAAKENPFQRVRLESYLTNMDIYITMLLQTKEHLDQLTKEMGALAKEIKEYRIIQSIPGIGEKIAATILSEIGEFDWFDTPKKIVAYAGLDPSIHQSGKFKSSHSRITKRGSKELRKALYLAVEIGISRSINRRLKAYYDQKLKEGKPRKVALIACANKMVHWIYAMVKQGTHFQEETS